MEDKLNQESATQQTMQDKPNETQPSSAITSTPSIPTQPHKRNFLPKVRATSIVILLGLIFSGFLWYLQFRYYYFIRFPRYFFAAPALLLLLLGFIILFSEKFWPKPTVRKRWLATVTFIFIGLSVGEVLWYLLQFRYQQYTLAGLAVVLLLYGLLILFSDKLWPHLTIRRRWLTAATFGLILSVVLWYIKHAPPYNLEIGINIPEYIVALPVLTMFLIILVRIGYTPNASKLTGFGDYTPPQKNYQRSKTLWDWLQLLIVPVILAAGALWFNAQQNYQNQQITTNQQQESALQAYFTNMSDLLLKNELTDSKTQLEASQLAHVWTLTTLRQLDPQRAGIILRFLYDANLIGKYIPPTKKGTSATIIKSIVDLRDANFSNVDLFSLNNLTITLAGADLSGANFFGAYLYGVDFTNANLSDATFNTAVLYSTTLTGANLSDATFDYTDLTEAHLERANLSNTSFYGAVLDDATLTRAIGFDSTGVKSLSGTTMPDGKVHP